MNLRISQSHPDWAKLEAFSLPAGIHLVVGDVKGGSQTPGMVNKVLAWRKTKAEGQSSS